MERVPPPKRSAFPALTHRDFRIFWIFQFVSLFGTWMQNVAQAWLVLELTDSPFKLGVVSAAQFLPVMLLSVFVGPLVDRFPKRRMLILTQSALMLLAVGLGAITALGLASFPLVVVFALCLGLVNTLDVPTRQSFVIELVGREDLVSGLALNSVIFNLARIGGPAIAGLLIAAVGIAPCFLINGASFVGVIAALCVLKTNGDPTDSRGMTSGVLASAKEGVAYAARRRDLGLPLLLMAAISAFVINYNIFVPTLARQSFGLKADGFGFLMTALGAGSFLGAFRMSARAAKAPSDFAIFLTASLMSCFLAVAGALPSIALTTAALAALGFASVTFATSCNAAVQTRADDAVRGRVMSLYNLVFGGVTPIGALWAGTACGHLGPRTAMALSGGLGLLASCLFGAAKKRNRTRLGTD